MKKEKYDKTKVMKDIIWQHTNEFLEEKYLNTTLTRPLISNMRAEYLDYLQDQRQVKNLMEMLTRMSARIRKFEIKYKCEAKEL